MSKDTLPRSDLKPCPFCGATATMEELPCEPIGVRFSVGCDSFSEAECMGYQSLTSFNTRAEAITAWNKRAPQDISLRTESKTYEGCHLHSVFPREYCRACYPEQTPPKTAPDNQMDYPPAAVHLDRSMVSVHGSDRCSSCDTGRITIYAASRQCLDCRTSRPPRSSRP